MPVYTFNPSAEGSRHRWDPGSLIDKSQAMRDPVPQK